MLKGFGRVSRRGGADSSRPPDRILFVEDMTDIFCVTLPDLWRLGQAYLKGSLFQGVALLTENEKKLAQKCEINRSKFEVRLASNKVGGVGVGGGDELVVSSQCVDTSASWRS